MTRTHFVRPTALAAMSIVTALSLWTWVKPARGEHEHVKAPHVAASAAAKAEQDEPSSESEEEGPAPINWLDFAGRAPPFVAVLLNFGILVGAYYVVGRKPVSDALQARHDSVAKDIEEAQRAKTAAEERAKIYQAKLERLEDEIRAAREALFKAGEAERERIVNDAEAKAERLRRDAQFLVEQELKQVRQDILREAVEAAIAGAGELLAGRVTSADQERLADEYLTSLSAEKGAHAHDKSAVEAAP